MVDLMETNWMNTSKALQIFEFKIFSDMTVVSLFHKRERKPDYTNFPEKTARSRKNSVHSKLN